MAKARIEPQFINRELSWIEFNARVLHEATRSDVPLLERLKFLCIVTSNFDEFFMVRVASVKRQIARGNYVTCPSGISPSDLLDRILERVKSLIARKYKTLLEEVIPGLAEAGLVLKRPADYTPEQSSFLKRRFHEDIFPVLTPVRATPGQEIPYISNLRLHAAFLLSPNEGADFLTDAPIGGKGQDEHYLAIVQIPASLERLIFLPEDSGTVSFALLEDVIVQHAAALFPGYRVVAQCLFRVTRDADMGVDEERDEDFVEAMEQVLARREFSKAVRLSIAGASDPNGELRGILSRAVDIPENEVFEKSEPLDLGEFMSLTSIHGFDQLKYERWHGYESPEVPSEGPLWESIRQNDILFHHPFESFEPIVRLLNDAADDPKVLSIKMTLYRTSGDSPIVQALERAARSGKQVTVLVEIKARFDEERNITWAERLEQAGVIVVYGIARLKVHAKALLIVRREQRGIQRYVHLGTGNYNDKTARLYTDVGLLTARQEIAYETGLFFNAITGYSAIPALSHLVMAPTTLKSRLLQLIEREAMRAAGGGQGRILAKMNSLADPEVIKALYEASRAGVEIKLNIRGICMLVPGVAGLSDTIEVTSVIDRYLEHARIISFHNGGVPEVYAASADWMPRNLERRVELMFPITEEWQQRKAISILETCLGDTTNAHRMLPDGTFAPPAPGKKKVRSQLEFQEQAKARTKRSDHENEKVFEVRRKPPKA